VISVGVAVGVADDVGRLEQTGPSDDVLGVDRLAVERVAGLERHRQVAVVVGDGAAVLATVDRHLVEALPSRVDGGEKPSRSRTPLLLEGSATAAVPLPIMVSWL
jgi:hypothetical protein